MLDDDKTPPSRFDTPNDYAFVHGEQFCGAVPDDCGTTYPHHCLHGPTTSDQACCWCGDVFIGTNIDAALHGSNFHPLTPREVAVAQLIASGHSNKLIGKQLDISEHTAKFHVDNVIRKLKAVNRAGAAAEAVRRGVIS